MRGCLAQKTIDVVFNNNIIYVDPDSTANTEIQYLKLNKQEG